MTLTRDLERSGGISREAPMTATAWLRSGPVCSWHRLTGPHFLGAVVYDRSRLHLSGAAGHPVLVRRVQGDVTGEGVEGE